MCVIKKVQYKYNQGNDSSKQRKQCDKSFRSRFFILIARSRHSAYRYIIYRIKHRVLGLSIQRMGI